jgi:hypothetical protein
MKKLALWLTTLAAVAGPIQGYCQPGDGCWPTEAEVRDFEAGLSKGDGGCLPDLPVFVSSKDQGGAIENPWFADQVK